MMDFFNNLLGQTEIFRLFATIIHKQAMQGAIHAWFVRPGEQT